MLRNCGVIGIEGTHASGKTTLAYALAAHYRERGVHAAAVEEPARNSPFIEEIVVHNRGTFDIETETDLFAAQLTAQLRAARQHTLIIADKTIANVVAYARMILPARPGTSQEAVLDAMTAMASAMGRSYDAVFYCCDRFSPHQDGDRYRDKVAGQQAAADRIVRAACAAAGQRVIDIPPSMTTADRVAWIAAHVTRLGLPGLP